MESQATVDSSVEEKKKTFNRGTIKMIFKKEEYSVRSHSIMIAGEEWFFTLNRPLSEYHTITNQYRIQYPVHTGVYQTQITISRKSVLESPKKVPNEIRYVVIFAEYDGKEIILKRGSFPQNATKNITLFLPDIWSFFQINSHFEAIRVKLDISVSENNKALVGRDANMFSATSSFSFDCVLLVEGKKVYIDKKYLSMHSAFFKAMFELEFREKEQAEIELKDVNFNEFIEMLSVIYPIGRPICDFNVEHLLKLADRFIMQGLTNRCEKFLLSDITMRNLKKLLLAQQHHFLDLQKQCADQYRFISDIRTLEEEPEYPFLNDSSKALLFESLLRANKKSN